MATRYLLSRRKFCRTGFVAGALLGIGGVGGCTSKGQRAELVGVAANGARDIWFVVGFGRDSNKSGDLRELFRTPLPGRGHEVVVAPDKSSAVVLARRPGSFAVQVDLCSGDIVRRFSTAPDNHFYGHGAYVDGGRYLLTTEHAISRSGGAQGRLVIRDADTMAEVTQLDSHGVGPHQVKILSDGETLVVANGGLRSRSTTDALPESSSLDFVALQSGQLLESFQVPDAYSSIRHLDVQPQTNGRMDRVVFGVQRQASPRGQAPLVWLLQDGQLHALDAPTGTWQRFNNYTASVAITGEQVAVSGPRGQLLSLWDLDRRCMNGIQRVVDVAALGVLDGRLYAGNGRGVLRNYSIGQLGLPRNQRFADLRWGNHLTVV